MAEVIERNSKETERSSDTAVFEVHVVDDKGERILSFSHAGEEAGEKEKLDISLAGIPDDVARTLCNFASFLLGKYSGSVEGMKTVAALLQAHVETIRALEQKRNRGKDQD